MVQEDYLYPILGITLDENVAWVRVTVYISINKDHLAIKKAKLVSNLGNATIAKKLELPDLSCCTPNYILCERDY